MRTVELIEHQTVSVGDSPDCTFSFAELADLERVQPAKTRALYWTSQNTVTTTEQVGMIATHGIRLEILPKVGNLASDETRAVLVRMIAAAMNVPLHDGEITGHHCQSRDLLEVLIGLFAKRLQAQLRAGLSRAYQRHAKDLSRLRGKLDVMRQFTRLAATPQKLACQYDELTADTALNRLLLCALMFLRQHSLVSDTQRVLNEIVTHFEDVSRSTPQEVLNQRIVLARVEQRWSVLEGLARLLLSTKYQTTHSGTRDGVALLFDMNFLFERYVAVLSRRVTEKSGYRLQTQGPQRGLATDQREKTFFHTKPDLHLHCGEDVVVVDTKWKYLDKAQANLGIVQADVYQLHGYAQVYEARTVALVYPHHPGMGEPGVQGVWFFNKGQVRFKVVTIDLTQPELFAGGFGELLEVAT